MTPTFSVHRTLLGVLVGVLLVSLVSLPKAQAATITQTRYLGSDTITWLTYMMLRNLTDIDSFQYYYKNITGTYDGNIQVGFRAYRGIIDSYYTMQPLYEELTSGVTVLWEKANSFEGWATTTWTAPNLNLSRLDFLELIFYARARTSAVVWGLWAIFDHASGVTADTITENLCMDSLVSSDWNFTFYLKCWRETVPFTKRIVRIYLGNSTYDSHISNMQFDNGITEPTTAISPYAMLILGFGFGFLLTAVVFRTSKPTTTAKY